MPIPDKILKHFLIGQKMINRNNDIINNPVELVIQNIKIWNFSLLFINIMNINKKDKAIDIIK